MAAKLTVLLAAPRGFCAGVERAIQIVEQGLKRFGAPVYVRHEIVHNRFVVEELEQKGAVFVDELDEVPEGAPVVFSAHGVPKSIPAEAERREMIYVDATCPLVSKVHREAERHHADGRMVVLIGHAGHPEIIGTMGQLPNGAVTLVETREQAESIEFPDPDRALAYITQTTLSVDDTAEIRVRIQDPVLASKPGLKPVALLFRDGKLFGTMPLKADPQSFTFRGESAPLEPGDYEVRVKVPGIPEDAILAHTAFTVVANPFGELGLLHCDELLLRQMAGDSGGAYYREEDMHRLVEALSPYSDGRTLTTELPLWQSYWWFVPIILLLTAEWIIRRKLGLV